MLTALSEYRKEKRISQRKHRQPMVHTRRLAWQVQFGCGSLSITTPVSLLANKLDVRSILHGHVSLADANNSCVIHETMNGCKNLMIH